MKIGDVFFFEDSLKLCVTQGKRHATVCLSGDRYCK